MSVYMTEEEQLEAIKKWWNKYSNVITVILSLVLLTVAGFKYWNWHQSKISMQASNAYEHLMVAFSNQDNKGVRSYANQLMNEYSDTVYADAARLALAKLFVTREKYEKARENLDYVAKNSKMTALKQVARIRIARLFAAEKAYDKALAELTTIDDMAYMPVVNELKGDIYAATGKYQQAIVSYKEAITEVRTNGMGNLFLEMKTNELAALTQSMKTKNNALQAA
ncbi:TPA: YfgM family protein [Legionella feeleii]|uniref:Ancillary SecYEG translocon subunit n=1 Tax=Legionella feeleii TaxID=453 RepID=A0A0W0TIM7_9GAMM|nr:tetratricopeptide repeat protein [Legionella feeleii]KTC95432.1 transmembrane protein [Legionella feeleii]SPX60015.1 transmembrane protein [Legionella feeleii]STX38483.1 transmembrane protein [Legionella feeleii]